MKTKILLVDDNKKVRSILKSSLENKGLEVVEAVNGLDGLLIAKQQQFDGFLIDHKMPIMDGITLVRDLREMKQYSGSSMILMTTGSCEMLSQSLEGMNLKTRITFHAI